MDPFLFNLYPPLTPPDHQAINSFECHDLTLAPDFQDTYRDESLYNADKQQQTSTDWILSQYLGANTATSTPDPSCRLDLIGEPLVAVQPELQYQHAAPTDGMLAQANNTASPDHHRITHGFQHTQPTETLPALSSDYCDATSVAKSREEYASSSQQSTAAQLQTERNAIPSSPGRTFKPSMGSPERRRPKMPQGCQTSSTNKGRYKCSLCDKTFSRSTDRRRHEKKTVKHGATKRYPCDICKIAVLSRRSDVARHKKKCIGRMQNTHPHI